MKYIIITCTCLFFSCSSKKQASNEGQGAEQAIIDTVNSENDSPKKTEFVEPQTENSEEFLNLFKDVDPVGLHIFTSKSDGVPINVNNYKYVHDRSIFINIEACREGRSKIFAIGKFDLNNKYLALLTRQHSQYTESLVELLLWDKQQKKIIRGIELSDGFGDEGWYFDEESWIKDFQFGKNLSVITWRKDSNADDNFKRTSVSDTLTISQFNGTIFVTKALDKKDTIGYTLKNWR